MNTIKSPNPPYLPISFWLHMLNRLGLVVDLRAIATGSLHGVDLLGDFAGDVDPVLFAYLW